MAQLLTQTLGIERQHCRRYPVHATTSLCLSWVFPRWVRSVVENSFATGDTRLRSIEISDPPRLQNLEYVHAATERPRHSSPPSGTMVVGDCKPERRGYLCPMAWCLVCLGGLSRPLPLCRLPLGLASMASLDLSPIWRASWLMWPM